MLTTLGLASEPSRQSQGLRQAEKGTIFSLENAHPSTEHFSCDGRNCATLDGDVATGILNGSNLGSGELNVPLPIETHSACLNLDMSG